MSLDYSSLLNETLCGLKPSGIRRFFDLLGDHRDAISLTVGQPDFITPWHIRAAGIESLEHGKTYYTSNSGMAELRHELCAYLDRRFDLHYKPEQTLITVGGSEAIDLAVRACIRPGDEVILPTPCYVCYDPLVQMAGGRIVPIELQERDLFRLTPAQLRAAITPRTKMLILPFPNNPTGSIMTRADLEAIAEVLRGTNILVLSDEIYAELSYSGRHASIAAVEGMWERTILASGFSKAYAMTGWRLGYLAAPDPILNQMLKLHQFAIMCAPTTAQFAAIDALRNGDEDVDRMTAEYNRRRNYIVYELNRIGLPCFTPEGAFYVYPNIRRFGMSSEEFCTKMLDDYGVAIVPGTAFGDCGEGYARISYAYSIKHIDEALSRMARFVGDFEAGRLI